MVLTCYPEELRRQQHVKDLKKIETEHQERAAQIKEEQSRLQLD
jgi:hypothetical protein